VILYFFTSRRVNLVPSLTAVAKHQTKTELALHLLREKIRTGEFSPGQRLRLNSLTQELGMSPTPIREAFRLLQADGLVNYRPHQGIVVTEFSPDETSEIARLRGVLEPLATQMAVEAFTARQIRELERLHEKLLAAVASGRGTSLSAVNASWHQEIYEASGSSYLQEFIRQLWERYPWRTMWALPQRSERTAEEHSAVMAAIAARNGPLAAEQMRAHIESGERSLLDQLASEEAEAGA